ncbi:MAG: M23 family metallopeptidase [Bacteroidia bacterium]|nr:M23 family metallopeptidase [Bacteroidia bacterium]
MILLKMEGQGKKRSWKDRLRTRFRMVVMDDSTFEERVSVTLTPLGILVAISAITIVMTALVVSLIAFTPIREYIPGYADVGMQQDLIELNEKTDSLVREAEANEQYLANLKKILKGNDTAVIVQNPTDTTKKYENLNFSRSPEDSALRDEFENSDQYSLAIGVTRKTGISGYFFFAPVKGSITSSFNLAEEHFGVDVASSENESVKATLDGTVISSGWNPEDGYVIQVQHSNNLISVYKHNAALLKKTGQFVKAGEPIAIIGNSGEHSTGPHVHFEIWYNGAPVDPQEYVVF